MIVLVLACGLGAPAYGSASGIGEPKYFYQSATPDLLSVGSERDLLLTGIDMRMERKQWSETE